MVTPSDWMRDFKGKVTCIMDEIVIKADSQEEVQKIMAEISARIMGTACEYTQQAYMDGVRETEEALMETGVEIKATHKVTVDGRTWELPMVVWFPEKGEQQGAYYFWRALAFRCPVKGEEYLSGAIPEAYTARNDITSEYLIVERRHVAKRVSIWRRKHEEDKEEG